MSKILKDLYLGGKVEAKDKKLLQDLKIKYILNCTPSRNLDPETGCPCFFEKEKSFKYCRIPVFDNRGEDILGHMPTAFRFIEEGKHYGGVFVHCHKGISRSSSFVIGYLMKYNEMTLDEALSYIQSLRPIVAPNESFMEQLKQYDITLQKERALIDEKNAKDDHTNQSGVRIVTNIGASTNTLGMNIRDKGVLGTMLMPEQIEISTGPLLPQELSQVVMATTMNGGDDKASFTSAHQNIALLVDNDNVNQSIEITQPLQSLEKNQPILSSSMSLHSVSSSSSSSGTDNDLPYVVMAEKIPTIIDEEQLEVETIEEPLVKRPRSSSN